MTCIDPITCNDDKSLWWFEGENWTRYSRLSTDWIKTQKTSSMSTKAQFFVYIKNIHLLNNELSDGGILFLMMIKIYKAKCVCEQAELT